MESVSCFGTQKPWHERTEAVTANHGSKNVASIAGQGGAANAAFYLVSGGVPNQPTEILTQEVG